MSHYIALRLRKLPVVHWYLEPQQVYEPQQKLLVRTQHASEVARVLRMVPDSSDKVKIEGEPFVKEILRPLNEADQATLSEISRKDQAAFRRAKDIVQQHRLAMKLLKAEYTFDQTRLILYFKSETKVDFRDLLKSLATGFRTRIELRQVGVRDETKLLGGLGCCGKEVCCAHFMVGFYPVSTKMAKDQNLSLNPAKLSGICGRLLCCLAHEHNYYASFHGKFPKIGADICTGIEKGRVMDLNFITQKLLISYPDRRKLFVTLDNVKGRKDPGTGRNLWWVQEPGQPEPDLRILIPPPPPKSDKPKDKKRGPRPKDPAAESGAPTGTPADGKPPTGSLVAVTPEERQPGGRPPVSSVSPRSPETSGLSSPDPRMSSMGAVQTGAPAPSVPPPVPTQPAVPLPVEPPPVVPPPGAMPAAAPKPDDGDGPVEEPGD